MNYSNIFDKFKGKYIFLITCVLSAVMVLVLAFVAYGEINSKSDSNVNYKIVLDAGHGGEDGGAVGQDGIVEKDINLKIALKLKDLLQAAGYDVVMTREEDEAIYDDSAETLREKKRSDLNNRVKIIEKNSDSKTIFVSIHQNKFPNPKYFGTQIFYSKNDDKSQKLAVSIKESVVGFLQSQNTREIKPANKKIFLLNKAQIPAVVVECGFLSNEEEARKLSSSSYQSKMAFSIYCGIINYFINNP